MASVVYAIKSEDKALEVSNVDKLLLMRIKDVEHALKESMLDLWGAGADHVQ